MPLVSKKARSEYYVHWNTIKIQINFGKRVTDKMKFFCNTIWTFICRRGGMDFLKIFLSATEQSIKRVLNRAGFAGDFKP